MLNDVHAAYIQFIILLQNILKKKSTVAEGVFPILSKLSE